MKVVGKVIVIGKADDAEPVPVVPSPPETAEPKSESEQRVLALLRAGQPKTETQTGAPAPTPA